MSLEKLVKLVEKNKELTTEELSKSIWESGLMIPKDKYLNEIDSYKEKLATASTQTDNDLSKELEEAKMQLYKIKYEQADDAKKKEMEIERLTEMVEKSALKENRLEARNKFLKAGWEDEDKINDFIETFVTTDALKSTQAVDLFLETVTKERDEIKSTLEKDILKQTQNVDEGDGPKPPKNESFDDVVDSIVSELMDEEYF